MSVVARGAARRLGRLGLAVLAPLLLLVYVLAVNAWILDDAYITFRSVENFLNGHGLRWNVDERVQAYTHPLWFFVVSALVALTEEVYLTAISANLVLSLAAVGGMAWLATDGFRRDLWKVPLTVLALLSSKAVIDYASSGLENPLSYLLATAFAICLLSPRWRLESRFVGLSLFATLAFLNRQDTILLYAPALLGWAAIRGRALSRAAWAKAAAATVPAAAWLGFSLLYYGSVFPNTSYAKLSATGFPAAWRLERGLDYLRNSAEWDLPLYALMAAGIALCLRRRDRACLALYAGVVAYLVYVALYAGSATHLTGRFAAVPLFLAIGLFVHVLDSRRGAAGIGAALLAFNVLNPAAAIKFVTKAYDSERTLFRSRPLGEDELLAARSYIDAKKFIYPDFVPLTSNWKPGATYGPDNLWYQGGLQFRASPQRVHVGGFMHGEAIGYFGYAAGPRKFVIDRVGLTDPLLARLPAMRPARIEEWKSGHFLRRIPEGYVASVAGGGNLLKDPSLKTYYDKVRLVTRGPLLDGARLREIWRLNTGYYDALIEDYLAREVRPAIERARQRRSAPHEAPAD
jgi:arabinofuranosyltransferase